MIVYPINLKGLMFFGLILFFALPGCKRGPEKVEVIKNHLTGEISRRYYTIDGKKEGKMTDYYPDGKLQAERYFRNDTQVDKTTIYYPSGKIREVQYYLAGKVHGGDTIFYENGQPEFVVTFDKGLKDGYVRKWKPDGTLTYEAKYEHEKLVEVKGEKINPDTTRNN